MSKDVPWSRKARGEGPWDYIVIGSGMGGMTAAALLSEVGKRVLVLEQHYVAGGFTHMFNRPGYRWDVGVHAVGEVTERSMPGRLLARLSRGGLRWASLGDVYDAFHYPDGFQIDFPNSPGAFRANLREAFPRSGSAIDHYLDTVREVAAGMRPHYMTKALPAGLGGIADRVIARKAARFFARRTADVLGEICEDPRLRTVLAAQWGYYGSPPSRSSFAIQALVTKHFQWGGYYPVGGAGQIARTLLQTVADAGGWTRISADVDEILIEGDRAVGVRMRSGEVIRAGRVVSAAGVGATVRRLLPASAAHSPWVREVESLPAAPAHVCLYLGFKGDIRQAGASAANQWFYETWDAEDDAWRVGPGVDPLPRAPELYCSFPSLKDPEHDPGPEGRHTGEVVTFVPWRAFEAWRETRWMKRGEDYEAFKARLEQALLAQLLDHMPGLRPFVDHVELSTPLSTDHFARPLHGSIYGLEPTPERFACSWLRPRAPIDGLFFAGSDVATVGVIGAMMGGVLAALSAEPRRVTRYLGPSMRR